MEYMHQKRISHTHVPLYRGTYNEHTALQVLKVKKNQQLFGQPYRTTGPITSHGTHYIRHCLIQVSVGER